MSKYISALAGLTATAAFMIVCAGPAYADNCGNGSTRQGGEVCDNGGANSTQDVGCCAAGCGSFVSAGTTCRAAVGICDTQAETCNGTSGTCPADVVSPTTVVCRPSLAGVCDSAEHCTGTSNTCPADTVADPSTICRSSAGGCDPAETCDGTSGSCPANAKSPGGTVCRPASGICDAGPETCTGSSDACPADNPINAGVVCRPSGGICDPSELCTGTSSTCPADGKSSAVCRTSAGVCDLADSCDGTNDACPADTKKSTASVCRPAVNVACDVAENCDGGSVDCPDDVLAGACANSSNDGVDCTEAACLANGDCAVVENCTEICRGQGFWKNHSSDEKGHPDLIEQVLTSLQNNGYDGLNICGNLVTVSNETFTMASYIENICVLSKNSDTLRLDKTLAVTAVNCAISEGGNLGDSPEVQCDAILHNQGFTVKYTDCNALCDGNPVQDGPTADDCLSQMNCFNDGGKLVNGQCVTGACSDTQASCGDDEDCNDGATCVGIAGSCAEQDLCSEDLGSAAQICPQWHPASSPRVCNAAKHNSCTQLGGCF